MVHASSCAAVPDVTDAAVALSKPSLPATRPTLNECALQAMEQQTISIAKAGITTMLKSRAAVLAAANPPSGRYDDMKSAQENIDLQTTILSRFDLIFIVKDERSEERDQQVCLMNPLLQPHSCARLQSWNQLPYHVMLTSISHALFWSPCTAVYISGLMTYVCIPAIMSLVLIRDVEGRAPCFAIFHVGHVHPGWCSNACASGACCRVQIAHHVLNIHRMAGAQVGPDEEQKKARSPASTLPGGAQCRGCGRVRNAL